MLDDTQRKEVEELVGRLVPKLVAEEVIRHVAQHVADQVAEQLAELGVAPPPPPQTDRVPHTIWEGSGAKDFVFDPPFPHRGLLLVACGSSGYDSFRVLQLAKSEIRTQTLDKTSVISKDHSPEVIPVKEGVTHLGIEAGDAYRWRIEILDPDKLQELALPCSGERGAVFVHRLGSAQAVIRSAESVRVRFYVPCDCADRCDELSHRSGSILVWSIRKGKEKFVLPAEQGIVYIDTNDQWSLEAKGGR
ncbi:hypothetical protein KGQ20_00335 [Catenulispora sp. NF23]|uniref:Uncharacterized protein n=1 Tax=Catenulispora pinistramenti TaxID=2705254 RepID=A0ABS5KKV8_9ACTN|nr:hypothetical protein [Catenulispora pinistramenti]MBS2531212.1 hypothetical protein [Catenulispora pinistramenti]MBS2546669.1 hypothetical protein [Catenulispora pinistramenti]